VSAGSHDEDAERANEYRADYRIEMIPAAIDTDWRQAVRRADEWRNVSDACDTLK
jgi:hypothetical protein